MGKKLRITKEKEKKKKLDVEEQKKMDEEQDLSPEQQNLDEGQDLSPEQQNLDEEHDLSRVQQNLVAVFLEITNSQNPDTASQFLRATSWDLQEALQLFYTHDSQGWEPEPEQEPEPEEEPELLSDSELEWEPEPGINQEPAQAPTRTMYGDNSGELFPPPLSLLYQGSFHMAKETARVQDKWFLINVQSKSEFASHLLNRDLWANETVAETIKGDFLLWQVHDHTEEGRKVCTYYRLLADSDVDNALPVILLIDPITGQKLSCWRGIIEPEILLENLERFMDSTPKDHHLNLLHKIRNRRVDIEEEEKDLEYGEEVEELAVSYPALPEEPECGDRNIVCRVGIRLPDGRRVQRNFLRLDPIQLLWSFVHSQLKEQEAKTRRFQLKYSVPGSSKLLDYNSKLSFETSGVANSLILVSWE